MFKILILIGFVAIANNNAPTNIFCKAGNQGIAEQMYCGPRWSDISRLPLIEGRFQSCSSALHRGTLVLKVGDSEFEIEDPEFPFEVTLNGVKVTCDQINY